MRARIMIIGPRGSGKSTIAAYINQSKSVSPQGIQDIRYGEYTMDMPSGYLETPFMYDYLIASAQDSSVVFFLLNAKRKERQYPPGFAHSFTGKLVGVITNIDQVSEEDIEFAYKEMAYIGITDNIIAVSAKTGQNMESLLKYKEECTIRY